MELNNWQKSKQFYKGLRVSYFCARGAPPGVGCVGVGGQAVVPAEEEEAAAFRLMPLAPLPLLCFYQGTKDHAMLDLVLKKHKQPQKTSQTARGLALEKEY